MLESRITRQIRYVRVYYEENEDLKDQEYSCRLKLVQLGVMPTKSSKDASPLIKHRSVAKKDPKTGKLYTLGIIVREDGRFEVYSNFTLVYEYYNEKEQCIDVDTDFNKFYLKFVENSDLITEKSKIPSKADTGFPEEDEEEAEPIKFILRKAAHEWRNRISMSTSKLAQSVNVWNHIIDKRVSSFYKPYQHFLNFANLMLVAHRNMVSVYNMSADDKYDDFVATK